MGTRRLLCRDGRRYFVGLAACGWEFERSDRRFGNEGLVLKWRAARDRFRPADSVVWSEVYLFYVSSFVQVHVGIQHIADSGVDAIPLFSELFVFGVVGFGSHASSQIIQIVQTKVKNRTPVWGLRYSQATDQRFVGEGMLQNQLAFPVTQV